MVRTLKTLAAALGLVLTLAACTGPGLARGHSQLGPHGTLPNIGQPEYVPGGSAGVPGGHTAGVVNIASEHANVTEDDAMALTPSSPVNLVNMWRVTAAGETPNTWLRLEPGGWALWRECGPIEGGWQASQTAFVASNAFMGQQDCAFESWVVPWLSQAAVYQPVDGGFVLLGADGGELARLSVDGLPPSNPNVWDAMRQPPEITNQVQQAFTEPPELPSDISAPTRENLIGRWEAQGQFETSPYLEFMPDGTWEGSDGCNGVNGAWRLDSGGRLLATTGVQTLIGCDGVPLGAWMYEVGRAGTLANHNTLILYNRTGAELGRFTRD